MQPPRVPPASESAESELFASALRGLFVEYAPIVDAHDGEVHGYEAVARCTSANARGAVELVALAERAGKLHELGRATRRAALTDPERYGDARLFLSLHPADLVDPELPLLLEVLDVPLESVVLEIPERDAAESIVDVAAQVVRLRTMGFRIAVDDLGASYVGLQSFALLEPDYVKLDPSLVRGIPHLSTHRRAVRSMVDLCRDIGIVVVADGVETVAERDVLVSLGCDLLQGFLFAEPSRSFPDVRWPPGRYDVMNPTAAASPRELPMCDGPRIERVLLVDDDDDIRTICALTLRRVGRWEVVTASSGAEALTQAEAVSPDLIILDMMMPRMNGLDTLRALRAQTKTRHIPVVFMTAKSQDDEVERYYAEGAAGVVAKPFDPLRLPHEIRRVLLGSPP